MYRDELQDDEDLRLEIFHLKKQMSSLSTENNLLKVKIRKLQNEIIKKDKQMDVVLDPRKSVDVRKIFYERSASFVLNMKEKNDELLHLLHEKDHIIRRLQNQVDITKLYSQSSKKHLCKCMDQLELEKKIRQIQSKISCNTPENYSIHDENNKNNKKKNTVKPKTCWTPEREPETLLEAELEDVDRIKPHTYDIKEQYKNLSREHLLSIIENLKNQRLSPSSHQTSSRKSSPESDLERIELLCESPHEEIQQLHLHFLDMISEVDSLKSRISQLQNNQKKTENVLKKKNNNIDRLAQEIKSLRRPKPRAKSCTNRVVKCYSNSDLVTRVYSATQNDSNKKSSKVEDKKMKSSEKRVKNNGFNRNISSKKKLKENMQDAMIQVEPLASPEGAAIIQCRYVERDSLIITQKSLNNDENEKKSNYDDEVFEECDDESVAVN